MYTETTTGQNIDFYRLYMYSQPSSFHYLPKYRWGSEAVPLNIKFKVAPKKFRNHDQLF